MSRFWALMKMNMKLLLRNKGFLFFLSITPIVSSIILSLKAEINMYEEKELGTNVIELEEYSGRAIYVSDTSAFTIKVYDASGTELSEHVLKELAETGMFSVCRCDVSDLTEEQVSDQAKKDAFDDRAGTLLYLKTDFDQCVIDGNYEGAIQIYVVSDDERFEMFELELTDSLSRIHQLSKHADMDSPQVLEVLNAVKEQMPEKKVVSLSGKNEIQLTDEQMNYKSLIGYAFAIITLGFLFCGVCVAYTVIEEQNNKVYTRVMLSKLTRLEYLGSKFAMTIVISIVQTFWLGICIFLAKDMDFGINKFSFLIIIFLLGLIFSASSLLIGILLEDVMSANYAVFSFWSISALLAGLFFSIDSSSQALKTLSYLMPQRWFMKATEMLFVGDKSAYPMLLCITVAYLIVVLSVGGIGLKIKRGEA